MQGARACHERAIARLQFTLSESLNRNSTSKIPTQFKLVQKYKKDKHSLDNDARKEKKKVLYG